MQGASSLSQHHAGRRLIVFHKQCCALALEETFDPRSLPEPLERPLTSIA